MRSFISFRTCLLSQNRNLIKCNFKLYNMIKKCFHLVMTKSLKVEVSDCILNSCNWETDSLIWYAFVVINSLIEQLGETLPASKAFFHLII